MVKSLMMNLWLVLGETIQPMRLMLSLPWETLTKMDRSASLSSQRLCFHPVRKHLTIWKCFKSVSSVRDAFKKFDIDG